MKPELMVCGGCHSTGTSSSGPKYLGGAQDQWYGSLISDARFVNSDPNQSLLITKGAHAPDVTGKPTAPALSTKGVTAVQKWLLAEGTERVLPRPPVSSVVPAQEIDKFGKCMTLTDYNKGANDLMNQNTNQGPCTSCHETGNYVQLGPTATTNFNALKTVPYLMKFVLPTLNTDGSFKDIAQAYRFRDRGKELGHPTYTLTATRAAALDTFFTSTYTRYKAMNGVCP